MDKANKSIQIEIASENAFIVYFLEPLNDKTPQRISYFQQQIKYSLKDIIIELITSYNSILVIFDPFKTDHFYIRKMLLSISEPDIHSITQTNKAITQTSKTIELPVYYGSDVATDLSRVAKLAEMSEQEVIALHQKVEYRVFAIGFAPGFAYLGQVDERIATPRLATPRAFVPKGAVAIADQQTAIYPANSPGGWNIIGRCPKNMFSPETTPVMPFEVGDTVKFVAINKSEFIELGGHI